MYTCILFIISLSFCIYVYFLRLDSAVSPRFRFLVYIFIRNVRVLYCNIFFQGIITLDLKHAANVTYSWRVARSKL